MLCTTKEIKDVEIAGLHVMSDSHVDSGHQKLKVLSKSLGLVEPPVRLASLKYSQARNIF